MTKDLKPCRHCSNPCEIYALQIGDIFNLMYLRVCNIECLFMLAYDFLHKEGLHKDFLVWLEKQEEKDDQELNNLKQRKEELERKLEETQKEINEMDKR